MVKKKTWVDVKKLDPKNHLGLTYDNTEKEMLYAISVHEAKARLKEKEVEGAEEEEEEIMEEVAPAPEVSGVTDPKTVVLRTIAEKMKGLKKTDPRYKKLLKRKQTIEGQ